MQKRKSGRGRDDSRPYPFTDVSLQSIRDYLGHTYEEMTRQYIDYMPQRIAKANDEFFEMQGSSLASWLKKEEKDGK